MRDVYVLIRQLNKEGFGVEVGPTLNGNYRVCVKLDTGYVITESLAPNVDCAIQEAFLDTPDLEEARQVEADDIPF
jgi:hypothetical protein